MMTVEDPLFFWRLHDDLKVADAAILMVGGDPAEEDSHFDPIGEYTYTSQNRDYTGFTAAFSALKNAIKCEEIQADIAYQNPYDDPPGDPDWELTTLKVSSLKAWLQSKSAKDAFFVIGNENSALDDFMDVTHEHFAPELALAVRAWRALATVTHFRSGTKAAIEEWIEGNLDAWRGSDQLSTSAKERIIQVVNWRKTGGAPSTGG